MAIIEINTIEQGRLQWVAIYSDSDMDRAIRWGRRLVGNMGDQAPAIRLLDKPLGKVIGAWQSEGYESAGDE